jgi:hypothetical protein
MTVAASRKLALCVALVAVALYLALTAWALVLPTQI